MNFRYVVYSIPKGSPVSYADVFIPTTNVVMLDEMNRDRVKVLKQGYWRPDQARWKNSDTDEYTFCKTVDISHKIIYNFLDLILVLSLIIKMIYISFCCVMMIYISFCCVMMHLVRFCRTILVM